MALRGCNQVLWECGPELAAAAIAEGCVQELAAVIAPKLMGGQPARTPLVSWVSHLWPRCGAGRLKCPGTWAAICSGN